MGGRDWLAVGNFVKQRVAAYRHAQTSLGVAFKERGHLARIGQ
jgi:hypothetical protein